ncbi:hypothetical protein CC80DRAFT_537561 [Byssothecium circinans]|uniref:Leo1-domain-containing protein n=1 Tax=Byssothecium circinans TaxID=147558 RepID=A0A6A5TMA6_9PLEO|nr:hypothetical protein CC80DRAFT_537561 [Byssothecium circinans]
MADDATGISSDEEAFTGTAEPIENEEVGAGDAGVEEDEEDLFGDGGDEVDEDAIQRKLDDEDLDSGDDEGRADRAPATPTYPEQQVEYNFMDADIARHPIPEPSDNELYLLKVPPFLTIEPTAFDHKTFQPPQTDHHSKLPPSDHFSAFNTATTTIRWRRSPSDRTKLQSNARILRWSDGSLTLQLANDPLNQYEINPTMLAPPQVNPRIPVPIRAARKDRDAKESYTYLSAIYEDAAVMRVTNKLTTALAVVPANNTKDDALEKLQNDLAKAATRGRDSADQAISFIDVNEDPELRRQREEAAFKEKQKQLRAREKAIQRDMERNSRTSNRTAYRQGPGGLDLGGLEGEEGSRRGGVKKPRKTARHGDWSDDDEPYRGRGNKEDEYDEDDDFIAASDEEEVVEEDDDDDDGITEAPKPRRKESPKRDRGGDDEDDDEDVQVRSKKRRVIEDDEDDEE